MSFKKNTLWNLLGNGLPLLAGAACIPYTLRHLGNEAFGVLTLIWSLIGYFSLFDFGAGRALTYELSRLRSSEQQSAIPSVFRAGLLLTALTGSLGTLITLVLAPSLVREWLHISLSWQQNALLAFQIAAIGVIPTTINSGLRGAMEGMDRFPASNLNKIFLGFCQFMLPALSLALNGPSLWQIALYLVLARCLVVVSSFVQLRHYLFATQNVRVITPDAAGSTTADRMRSLMSYGFWVTISSIISPLMVYGDRFFVSAMVGADKLSLYSLPQEGLMRVLIVPMAICSALMPAFATLITAQDLHKNYYHHYKRMLLVMSGLCLTAAVLAYPAMSWWLNPEFALAALPITLILTAGTWLNGIALVPHTFLHARGKTKLTAQFHLLELILYIVVLYVLATEYGLIGAAFAWTIRVVVDWLLLHLAVKRLLN